MTTKLGSSAFGLSFRLVIAGLVGLVSLVTGDQVRAGGVVVVAPPPISLTASDGAGLELVSLTADAGDRRSAGLHRAAPDLPQPGEPGARGALPDHAAVRRDHQPVRDADRRSLAGGGGRRAAGGARRLRGLPAPQAGPGAAGGGGGQRVLGAGVPHPGGGDEGDRHLLRAGADPGGRAIPAAAARIAAPRDAGDPRSQRQSAGAARAA